jgi:hypothetical protein
VADLDTDSLLQLFLHGPSLDGDIPDKAGRDALVEGGMVERFDGWNWLTESGVKKCLELGFGDRKEAKRNEEVEYGIAWVIEENGSDIEEAVLVWGKPEFSDLTEEEKEDIIVTKIEYRILPD